MSTNVNIISMFSFMAGNNVPLHLRKDEQPLAETDQPEQAMDVIEDTTSEEACEAPPCIYRRLLKRFVMVGALALAIGLLCSRQRGEADAD